jgi:hypothetical protein
MGTTQPRYKSASLVGRSPLRPSSGTPPRSRAGCPPRARPRLDREPNAPSSEFPSRSRASRATAPIPAPPVGAFNALTPAGVQVKGESTPLCARESRPAAALPTPVARPSPPLCDAVRHGQQPPRGTVLPTPVRSVHRTLEKGRWKPRRDDARLLRARTGRRRKVRPVGAVTSVAIGPVRSSLSPRRHSGHCITIPDAVEHAATRHRHASHCALYGLMSTAPSNPHADGPRTSNLNATPIEAAPGDAQDTP